MDRGAWQVTVHRVAKELDTTEVTEPARREYLAAIRRAAPGRQVLKHPQSEDTPLSQSRVEEGPSFLSTDGPRPSPPCRAALRKNRGLPEGQDSHGLSSPSARDSGKSSPLSGAQVPSTYAEKLSGP